MEGVPGVVQVVSQPLLGDIQRLIQNMCHWQKRGFPGAQPVSMRLDNMDLLSLASRYESPGFSKNPNLW